MRPTLALLLASAATALGCSKSPPTTVEATHEREIPTATVTATEPAPGGLAPLEQAEPLEHAGEPVHPLCVLALVGVDSVPEISLDAFSGDTGVVERRGATVTYRYPEDLRDGIMREPFVEYEVVAARGKRYVLRYLYNGGGTGYFSGLVSVDRHPHELVLRKRIHGGDRCNGGLAEVEEEAGAVHYAAEITPVDLVGLPEPSPPDALGDGLESSATSCFAAVHFRFDLRDEKASIVGVDFEGPAEDRPGWTDDFANQSCFNRVFNRHLGKGRSMDQVEAFVRSYRAECAER